MTENIKPVESLTVADFEAHPVWQWLNDDELGEMMMPPVELPVKILDNRILGDRRRRRHRRPIRNCSQLRRARTSMPRPRRTRRSCNNKKRRTRQSIFK